MIPTRRDTAWFVVFHTGAPEARTAALVAENEWEAMWTFQRERIREINRYVERAM